ncbi:MAG: DUF1549 domain-containing protein [Verrucomicrobiales bacterium]|nr:DUF1549 domain-containing protein [Verrucomicrobiales bacterium]
MKPFAGWLGLIVALGLCPQRAPAESASTNTPIPADHARLLARKAAIATNGWAFAPLSSPTPPTVRDTSWPRNPIDAFVLAPIEKANRTPTPSPERRVLLRRLHLDLLGMPPTPAELESFERDPSPTQEAWLRVVRERLERPQYGERWARHWLDVARFAESSGFEHDYDRPAAYHYRDFVIRALNDDMPYDQFVRWQLAGDEFEPDNPLALMATGFLGAGVFPTQITANEVERTRYDAMDDMLATTGTAMLGLTVGCARCHDHKSDPISTQEYYRLLATFTTTTRSELGLDLDPATTRREKAAFDATHDAFEKALALYEERELPAKFDAWLASGARQQTAPAWHVLAFPHPRSDAGATFRPLPDGSYLVEGTNGASDRYTLSASLPDATSVAAVRLEALADASFPKGGPGRADNGNIGLSRFRLYITSSEHPERSNEVRIARARATFEQNAGNLAVASALDENPHSGWAVDPRFGTNHAAVFVLETPIPPSPGRTLVAVLEFALNTKHNIGRPRLSVGSDTNAPLDGVGTPARIAALLARITANPASAKTLGADDRSALLAWWKRSDSVWQATSQAVEAHRATAPKPRLTQVLTCTEGNPPVRMHSQGADFFPETYFLHRGSTDQKRGVATQGFLQVLARAPDAEARWRWAPPQGAKYSGRRRTLANWITDTEQGAGHLLARVIVNRLWQHHFGRGLVETPNDFGALGARPTHPELLDWLADELIRQGWRLKPIHELMLGSAAYQVGTVRSSDSGPALPISGPLSYAAFHPRRLGAEAIRDSILFVTGTLDPRMYGPGTLDPDSSRRSIYFTIKRSQLMTAMQAFDVPEPLVSQATRPSTTVAPQALILMNSPRVRACAHVFALRLAATPETSHETIVRNAYLAALGRPPSADELAASTDFLRRQTLARNTSEGAPADPAEARLHAVTDFTQALLGLNEFVYVE